MSALQRWLMHVSFLALAVSGTAHAIMKYLMVGDDPYSAVGHPLQPWALAVHVLAAPVVVFAIGLMFRDHIIARYRQGNGTQGRGSGVGAMSLLLPMTASGYLLPTLTNEGLRSGAVIVHLATGGAYVVFYLSHVALSWRRRLTRETTDAPVADSANDRHATGSSGLARSASDGISAAGPNNAERRPSIDHPSGRSTGVASRIAVILAVGVTVFSVINAKPAAERVIDPAGEVPTGLVEGAASGVPCVPLERARSVMGTIARVIVCTGGDAEGSESAGLSDRVAAQAAGEALDAITRVDEVMSLYRADSDLSRLNRDGYPGPVALDPDLVSLLAESKRIAAETSGRFDVTIKPLMDYYGFYSELGFTAGAGGLEAALGRVGIDRLAVDEAAATVSFGKPGMGVDLGGIAKGFALDRAAGALRARGIDRAVLDLGRNILFVGPGPLPEGRWRAAIVDPVDPGALALCIEVAPGALSTSARSGRMVAVYGDSKSDDPKLGDPRAGVAGSRPSDGSGESGSTRIAAAPIGVGHVLDATRGAVQSRLLQATVWSPTATRADALSTAVLLLEEDVADHLLARGGETAILMRQDDAGRGWSPMRLGSGPGGLRVRHCTVDAEADRGPLGESGGRRGAGNEAKGSNPAAVRRNKPALIQ